MINWIPNPTTLIGETVELRPLAKHHLDELEALAKDKRIWEFYTVDCSLPATFDRKYRHAFEEIEKGTQYTFVIFHKAQNKLIGSTSYLDIQPQHKKLEIGFTWLHPDYWATEVNFECKLLLLTFCFETLKTIRVQLKTDETNIRSQKAIAKIGAQFEGILRHDMIRDNGKLRNSAYFSIIDTEWPEKKIRLKNLYEEKKSILSK